MAQHRALFPLDAVLYSKFHPKRSGVANDVYGSSTLDQAHASNQSHDVGSNKDSYEAHVLSLMRDNVYEDVSHINQLSLEDAVKNEKISA